MGWFLPVFVSFCLGVLVPLTTEGQLRAVCIPRGDLGHLSVGVLAFKLNYVFPLLVLFSLSATDPLLDLEVGMAACVACGGGGTVPSSSLVPRAHSQPGAPHGCILFCLWMCVICFVSFFFQATKGLEKAQVTAYVENRTDGAEQKSHGQMDRWADGRGRPWEEDDSRRLTGNVCCGTLEARCRSSRRG